MGVCVVLFHGGFILLLFSAVSKLWIIPHPPLHWIVLHDTLFLAVRKHQEDHLCGPGDTSLELTASVRQ